MVTGIDRVCTSRTVAAIDDQRIPRRLCRQTDDLDLVVALAAQDGRGTAKVGQIGQDQKVIAVALVEDDLFTRQVHPHKARPVIARAKAMTTDEATLQEIIRIAP